jgi:hypothetical protein
MDALHPLSGVAVSSRGNAIRRHDITGLRWPMTASLRRRALVECLHAMESLDEATVTCDLGIAEQAVHMKRRRGHPLGIQVHRLLAMQSPVLLRRMAQVIPKLTTEEEEIRISQLVGDRTDRDLAFQQQECGTAHALTYQPGMR